MPRSSFDPSFPYHLEIAEIIYLKRPVIDCVYDLKIICGILTKRYSNYRWCPHVNSIFNTYHAICHLNVVPEHANRLYVFTRTGLIPLTLIDLDASVFDNLVSTFNSPMEPCPSDPYRDILLFAFNETKLVLSTSLDPWELAELLLAFKNENEVNSSGIRDSFYGRPRRLSRKRAQSSSSNS